MCLAALYDMVLLSNISLLLFQVWLWACVCLRVGPASPVCAGVYEWIRLAWGKQTTRGRWQRVKCCHAQPPANQRWEYSLLNPPTAENSQWDCTVPFHQGHVQVHTTFCYGFRVERHVSWKRSATGFEIRFLLFGGCVKNVSSISSNMYVNHSVLKRQLTQWVQVKSFNTCPLQLRIRNNWRY